MTRHRPPAVVVAVLGALVAFGSAPAYADRSDRADQLFKKGKKLLAEKKYPEACTAFEDSDRLDPGIGAKLNIAKCYQEWGKLATAWRWFSDAARMADATKDERARRIRALIADLDPSVPRLTVHVPPALSAAGITVKLDGFALEASAFNTERRVDPGPHQVDYIVDGVPSTKVIPVERGASSEITLDRPARPVTSDGQAGQAGQAGWARPPGPLQPGTPAEPAAASDLVAQRKLLGLGVGGVGVAAIAVAGIVTLRARSDYNHAIAAHCNGAPDMCDATGLTATQSARHRANVSTVVAVVGLAAVGGGAALYYLAPAVPHGDEHALYLAPSVGDGGMGIVLGGRF